MLPVTTLNDARSIQADLTRKTPVPINLHKVTFIGTAMDTSLLVNAPVHYGRTNASRVEHLDISMWINPGVTSSASTFDYNRNTLYLDLFHDDDADRMSEAFVLVCSPQPPLTGPNGPDVHPVNQLVNILVPGLRPRWRGNLLIIKYDVEGQQVKDMKNGDAQLVFHLLSRLAQPSLAFES
ncbi:hypothetical protein C8J57DRAFT_1506082 [Mycena rebaudengoi]|nr:hypothetical protein C8J57DRAFT_1506082 [Mycena rebaudengoi]